MGLSIDNFENRYLSSIWTLFITILASKTVN